MRKITLFFALFVSVASLLAQPASAQQDKSPVSSILDLEENLAFLHSVSNIFTMLDEIHQVAQSRQSGELEGILSRSTLRKFMTQDVECKVPFESADSKITEKDKSYLSSFVSTLDSLNKSYKQRSNRDLGFEIAVLGYTDQSGTAAKNAQIANARAQSSADYLKFLAKEKSLNLKIVKIEGRPLETPEGKKEPCSTNDASCRICKIVLTRLVP